MKSLRLVLFALCAVLAALAVGRCQGVREARADLKAAEARHEADRLTLLRKHQTDSLYLVQRARIAEERAERVARRQLQEQTRNSQATIDSARAVLADTAASYEALHRVATEATHNLALQVVFSENYRKRAEARFAQDSAERALLASALATSDSLGATWRAEAERLAKKQVCRVGFIPCPTRTQASLGTAVVIVAAYAWFQR